MASSSPYVKFRNAFCGASGSCPIRIVGNDSALQDAATQNAKAIATGHSFIILMKEVYPIAILNAIKQCQEVCTIFCATANPVEVIVAETAQGRGVIGIVDGFAPRGLEDAEDVKARRDFFTHDRI